MGTSGPPTESSAGEWTEVYASLRPISWREWYRATKEVACKLGISVAEVGEMRVIDVLKALHASNPADLHEYQRTTCTTCGGLAIEVNHHGDCRRCSASYMP